MAGEAIKGERGCHHHDEYNFTWQQVTSLQIAECGISDCGLEKKNNPLVLQSAFSNPESVIGLPPFAPHDNVRIK